MKSPADLDRGLAAMLDLDGALAEVIRDDLELTTDHPLGRDFEELVDEGAREKARRFLDAVLENRAAFDWELNALVDGRLRALHFAGTRIGDRLLVVAAPSPEELERLNEELMRMNSEQTNALRAVSRTLATGEGERDRRGEEVYEELSRVNNELANLQRELTRQNLALERLNEEKTRLLGMAAHDLRTPLGVILSYSNFLEREAAGLLPPGQMEFVQRIRAASGFMLRMVDDLLDVSAIESGRLSLDLEACDLVGLVTGNVEVTRVLAGAKEIALELEAPESGPPWLCDPGKVEQVLNNLVTNAIKFSERGTTVTVRLEFQEDDARISVEDEGQGIPEEELPKLFRPFGTTSVRGTEGEGSTGLGLAIARRIVEGHGGRMEVASEEGRGSTFHFSLPRMGPDRGKSGGRPNG